MDWIRINRSPVNFNSRKDILKTLESEAKTLNWLDEPVIDKTEHVDEIKNIHQKYAQYGDRYFETYDPEILKNTFLLMLDITQEMVNGRDPFANLKMEEFVGKIYPQLIHEELLKYYKKDFEAVCVHQNGIGNTKLQFFSGINYSTNAHNLRSWFFDSSNYKLKQEGYSPMFYHTNFVPRGIKNLTDFFYKPSDYQSARARWIELSKNIYKWKYDITRFGGNIKINFELLKTGSKLGIAFFDSCSKPKYKLGLADSNYKEHYDTDKCKFYIWDMYEIDDTRAQKTLRSIFFQLANPDINSIYYFYAESEDFKIWMQLFSDTLDYIFDLKSYELILTNWKKKGREDQHEFLCMAVKESNELYNRSKKLFKFE